MAHSTNQATTKLPRAGKTQPLVPAPAFRASGLMKSFHLGSHIIPVLRGLDLEVRFGEWVALVGPSGCGKTTLLHLLGLLDVQDNGKISCRGRQYDTLGVRQKAEVRRQEIGFVFQAHHLLPELTALENVVLPALRWGCNKQVFRDRATELLSGFGLSHRLKHRPQEMSGGEQQRVALARALINDPPILLADEPTGNLDPVSSGNIIGILEGLHRDQGKTIVMVTHDMALARRADRVVELSEGQASPLNCSEPPG